MNGAAEHDDNHLGHLYAWTVGDLRSAQVRATAELADMGLGEGGGALALDLGAGLGLHSAALARAGFRVIAIDDCEALLGTLRARYEGLPVQAVHDDLSGFARHLDRPAAVILCLGDTLTHLPSLAAVHALCDAVRAALAPGGLFAASFRDYVSTELQGNARYILVKRDERRVLTCCLDYGPEQVTVQDILTERRDDQWVQTVSSYPRLRLAPGALVQAFSERGLRARVETAPAGMVRVVATRTR